MDFSAIASIISSVGFPIACCIYLIWSNTKQTETHAAEIEKLRETVDNNTKAMLKLCNKLGVNIDD